MTKLGPMNIDGSDVPLKSQLEELANVVMNYPVSAGDTISPRAAKACCLRAWTVRDGSGNWIPTRKGITIHEMKLEQEREARRKKRDQGGHA